MKTNTKGPAPRRDGTTRSDLRGATRTILVYRVRQFLSALAILAAFLPSVALAQTALDAGTQGNAPGGSDIGRSDEAHRIVRRASQESGVTPGHCEGGVSDTCAEITVGEGEDATSYACHHEAYADAPSFDERLARTQAQFGHFQRLVTRGFAAVNQQLHAIREENAEQNQRLAAEEAFDQRFYGWNSETPYAQRLTIARETGRYLREVVPALIMEDQIAQQEGDQRLQEEIDQANQARQALEQRTNDKFHQLEEQIAAERRAREADVAAINRRLDRHTISFLAGLDGEMVGSNPLVGGTVSVVWRTGGFAASARFGGLYSTNLGTGTFVAGASAGPAFDIGESLRLDVFGYGETLQLPEDRVGERTGSVVQSAGALFFELGGGVRLFANRRGPGFVGELRIGVADPPGSADLSVVFGGMVGFSYNAGL